MPLPDDRGIFVEVPPNAAVLNVAVGSDSQDAVSCGLISPSHAQDDQGGCVVINPEPGVWEVNVFHSPHDYKFDADRPRPLKPTKVRVAANVASVHIAEDLSVSDTQLRAGNTVDIPVRLKNVFAPVFGALAPSDLGSGFETEREIGQGEQHLYEVVVPEGATSLLAWVKPPPNIAADLDVYAFYIGEEGAGRFAAEAATVNSDEGVEIRDPDAGLWRIVVVGAFVPGGRTRYRYLDVYTHAKFGTISTTDVSQERRVAAEWTTTAHVWIASLPEAPRVLMTPLLVADGKSEGDPIGRKYVSLVGDTASTGW